MLSVWSHPGCCSSPGACGGHSWLISSPCSGHSVLLHFLLILSLFLPLFAPRPFPLKPCITFPLGLVFMFTVLCFIPLTIQCFLVNPPQLLHTCPVPPGTPASTISEHFVNVSILVTHRICSPREFPAFLAGHISGQEGERNNCCRAQGSGCLAAPLLLFNNLSVAH